MKRFLTLFFLFFAFSSFSQDYVPEKVKHKKHSIGLNLSPVEFVLWRNLPYSELWSSGPESRYINQFSPSGISYQFRLNYFIKINVSGLYSREYFEGYAQGVGSKSLSYDYEVQYIKVPLGIRLCMSHLMHENAEGGFFIQPGVNFDIAIREDVVKTSTDFHDPRYGTPPGGWPISEATVKETHSSEWKFHKISPSVFVGHEIVGDYISFFYGGRLETLSIIQNKNLQEDFKNRSFSLINVGFNYRF